MNTANLQMEGMLAAVSALMLALQQNGALTVEEMDRALADAEGALAADPNRPDELRAAHVDGILFPVRYLRLANRLAAGGEFPTYTELAAQVGREKPDRGDFMKREAEDIEQTEDEDVRRWEERDRLKSGF